MENWHVCFWRTQKPPAATWAFGSSRSWSSCVTSTRGASSRSSFSQRTCWAKLAPRRRAVRQMGATSIYPASVVVVSILSVAFSLSRLACWIAAKSPHPILGRGGADSASIGVAQQYQRYGGCQNCGMLACVRRSAYGTRGILQPSIPHNAPGEHRRAVGGDGAGRARD